jgi:tetrahydromethanopterin S-methyltransferase subunit B
MSREIKAFLHGAIAGLCFGLAIAGLMAIILIKTGALIVR